MRRNVIGWRVVSADADAPPPGMTSDEVYALAFVLSFMEQVNREDWRLLPVFGGDIGSPIQRTRMALSRAARYVNMTNDAAARRAAQIRDLCAMIEQACRRTPAASAIQLAVDDLIHDCQIENASDVNNGGFPAQIGALAKALAPVELRHTIVHLLNEAVQGRTT
jgi:hypothetical protein